MIRIGLLGASRIARGAVIAPARDIAGLTVACIAARSSDRACAYADAHGIPDIESDYAGLVSSDQVDLVYNGLPPSEHMEWTIAALKAGKHVLCEKPFAMNAMQAEAMVDAANEIGTVLIEAFHYRFHPLFSTVMEILRSRKIGEIRSMRAHFCVPVAYTDTELRYKSELGGGAMMDLGCYPVHWIRTVMGAEPDVISARADRHASGVDTAMAAELKFADGTLANVRTAMDEDLPEKLDAELQVTGSEGELVVDNPLAPHIGHELRITTSAGTRSQTVEGQTTYHHQLQHVLDVINGDARSMLDGADAIGNMRVLDAIYAAAGMPSISRMAGEKS